MKITVFVSILIVSTSFIQSNPLEYQFSIDIFNPVDSNLDIEIEPANLNNSDYGEIFLTQSSSADSIIEIHLTKRNLSEGQSIKKELIDFGFIWGFAAECFLVGYEAGLAINGDGKIVSYITAMITMAIIPTAFILLTEDQDEYTKLKQNLLLSVSRETFKVKINGIITMTTIIVENNEIRLNLREYKEYFREGKNEILLFNERMQIGIHDKL